MFHHNEIRGRAKDRLHRNDRKHYRTDHLRRTPTPDLLRARALDALHPSHALPKTPLSETPLSETGVDDPRWSTATIDDYDGDIERPGEVATIVSVLAFLALIAILA